jgi:hypothetical protein
MDDVPLLHRHNLLFVDSLDRVHVTINPRIWASRYGPRRPVLRVSQLVSLVNQVFLTYTFLYCFDVNFKSPEE